MTRPVVVPLDGSQLAEHALPLAVAVSRRGDVPLHLVSVNEPPQFVPGTAEGAFDPAWAVPGGEDQREYLDRVTTGLREDGLSVEVAVLDGLPAEALLEYAAEQDASLLVVATHGRGGLDRAWLGSTTDRLLRHGSLPMLVVRASEDERVPLTLEAPGRVLVPLDGSELAEQIIGPATAIGRILDWEYELVRVVPVPYTVGSSVMVHSLKVDRDRLTRDREEAEAYLEGVRGRLAEGGAVVRTRVVEAGDASLAEAILDTASDAGAGVVAMATHGRGGLRRMVLGSVADKLIRASDLPLLVFHPEEAEE